MIKYYIEYTVLNTKKEIPCIATSKLEAITQIYNMYGYSSDFNIKIINVTVC